MQLTEEQKQEVKETFRRRRNRQLIVSLPMVGVILVFAFLEGGLRGAGMNISENTVAMAFVALIIAAVVFSVKNWRCPACHGYLGKAINPKFCAKCGTQLQ